MAIISSDNARYVFTKDLLLALNIMPPNHNYLLSKFNFRYKPVEYVSWQVRRWSETTTTSIVPGSNGNRIKATGITEKVDSPPLFHLLFNINDLVGYNAAFGTNNPAESAVDDLLEETAIMYGEMKNIINRTYELQAAQALQTGIVIDPTNGNYDFKRNPASIVDLGAGNYWDNASVDPFAIMESGGTFLRQYGKVGGNTMDCVMGASAYRAFLKNNVVLERAQKLWNILTPLTMPALREDGSVFMGQVSAGPYLVNIFTYPHFYTSSTEYQVGPVTVKTIAGNKTAAATANTSTPYINDVNIVMLPSNPRFLHACALVPKLPKQVNGMDGDFGDIGEVEEGKFFAYDYQDVKLTSWEMNCKSRGLTVLAAVDEVFTGKVMGS